jgi:DNA-directed RNA polymerase specialized sigma subunit
MKADIDLIRKWQRTGDPVLLEEITKQIRPIVFGATNKWSGILPDSAFRAKAMQLAIDALRNYDESKGALSTYLYTRLQKVSRDVYKSQNAMRIPEGRITDIGALRSAETDLEVKFGREPTDQEVADELTWNPDRVAKLRGEARPEMIYYAGQDLYGTSAINPDPMVQVRLNYAYSQLSPHYQEIFDYLTGMHGKPELTPAQISTKMGVAPSTITRVKQRALKLVG